MRAIWGFCHHLKSKAQTDSESSRQLLVPLLPALVDGLVNMATNFSHSSEILGLILENLAVVLSCDPGFTAGQEAKVITKSKVHVYSVYKTGFVARSRPWPSPYF